MKPLHCMLLTLAALAANAIAVGAMIYEGNWPTTCVCVLGGAWFAFLLVMDKRNDLHDLKTAAETVEGLRRSVNWKNAEFSSCVDEFDEQRRKALRIFATLCPDPRARRRIEEITGWGFAELDEWGWESDGPTERTNG